MATREAILKRAELAANFQAFVTSLDQAQYFFEAFNIPADQDMVTVPAAPDESAAVTMHRMERTGSSVVVLLTSMPDQRHFRAIPFHFRGPRVEQVATEATTPAVPLESGVSVADWLNSIDEVGGVAWTVEDSSHIAFLGEQFEYETFA